MSLYADGGGYNASGTAVAYTPEYAYNGSNVFFQCASGLPPCANGTYDFSGVLGIPGGRGGNLYLSAGCGGDERLRLQLGRQRRRVVARAPVVGQPAALKRSDADGQRGQRHAA